MTGLLDYAPTSDFAVEPALRIFGPNHRRAFEPPRVLNGSALPPDASKIPQENPFPGSLAVSAVPDAVLLPRHVVLSGDYRHVLSATFLRPRRRRHRGVELVSADRYRVVRPYDPSAEQVIQGTSFYLDCEGALNDQTVWFELWTQTWPLALLDRDDLTFVTSLAPPRSALEVLADLGVRPERIRQIGGATRCEMLLIPSPAAIAQRYVHPVCGEVFDRVSTVGADAARRPTRRIFLAEPGDPRHPLTNRSEIAALADRHGLEVIDLSALSTAEVAQLMAETRTLVGLSGASMYTAVLTRPGADVLTLSPPTTSPGTEVLLAQGRHRLSCLFGATEEASGADPRITPWSVLPDEFEAALAEVMT